MVSLLLLVGIGLAFLLLTGQDPEEKRLYAQAVAQETQAITDNLKSQIEEATEAAKSEDSEDVPQTGISAATPDSAEKKLLEESLDKRYRGILEQLKGEATGMLNGLLSQAKADYEALKVSGKNDAVTIGNLAGRYLDRVDVMESHMDASFNTVVQDMETHLKAQGIDPAPIISKYRSEYQQVKEANRKAFMDKAWSFIS